MWERLFRFYRKVVNLLLVPVFLYPFLKKDTGQEYGIGFLRKVRLLLKVRRNTKKILSATSWHEHVLMLQTIFNIPKSTEGVVVECGSFKGASTASLSLACSLTNRKLVVFDSFEGLPEPDGIDKAHHCLHRAQIHRYSKGAYCGGLEEVKKNIQRYGALEACEFVPGYFEQTLPGFTEKTTFIFLDVDLRSSLETCISHLWPLLQDGGTLFTHEARHSEMASLFFDKPWWQTHVKTPPPGLVGAGSGLSFNAKFGSNFGYTRKMDKLAYTIISQDKK